MRGEREAKEGTEKDGEKTNDGKQGKKKAIPLFKNSENISLLVTGVSVNTYPHTTGGADPISSSIAKFNWKLLKTVTMPKGSDFIIIRSMISEVIYIVFYTVPGFLEEK